jgi:hypothetical protein
VLPNVQVQALYLGSAWSGSQYAQTKTAADSALADMTGPTTSDPTGGAYLSALEPFYGVGPGTSTPGVIDSRNLRSGSTISDHTIQNDIQSDINSGLLKKPDPANNLYVVFVQPNVAASLPGSGTTEQGILGWHGAFVETGGTIIHYAVIAYPGGTVGNSTLSSVFPKVGTAAISQLTAVTSHELAEAVTDPDVSFASAVGSPWLGWYDPNLGEIGDVQENNAAAFVQLTTGVGTYWVQEVGTPSDGLLTVSSPLPAVVPAATTSVLTLSTSPNGPYTNLTVTVTVSSGAGQVGGIVELVINGSAYAAEIEDVNGKDEAIFNFTVYGQVTANFSAEYLGQVAGSTTFGASASNTVTATV